MVPPLYSKRSLNIAENKINIIYDTIFPFPRKIFDCWLFLVVQRDRSFITELAMRKAMYLGKVSFNKWIGIYT